MRFLLTLLSGHMTLAKIRKSAGQTHAVSSTILPVANFRA